MMRKRSPLENIKIASPCSQDWNSMTGNDRQRFCGACELNVYNLSGMTRNEAERLIMSAEGRLCVRFFRRADGTVITQDCPVGWARIKKRATIMISAVASMLFTFFSAVGFMSLAGRFEKTAEVGAIAVNPNANVRITRTPVPLMGNVAIPREIETVGKVRVDRPEEKMGEVAVPPRSR